LDRVIAGRTRDLGGFIIRRSPATTTSAFLPRIGEGFRPRPKIGRKIRCLLRHVRERTTGAGRGREEGGVGEVRRRCGTARQGQGAKAGVTRDQYRRRRGPAFAGASASAKLMARQARAMRRQLAAPCVMVGGGEQAAA